MYAIIRIFLPDTPAAVICIPMTSSAKPNTAHLHHNIGGSSMCVDTSQIQMRLDS